MAEATGDDWAVARALNALGYLQSGAEPDQGRATLARSVELGRKIGDPWAIADGIKMTTVAWLFQDDFDGMAPSLDELRRVAEPLGNAFFMGYYHCCVGMAATRRGELAVARRSLETSLALCREIGEPVTGGIALAFLGEIEMLRGDYDAAASRLDAFLKRAVATGGAIGIPWAMCYRATLALGLGRTDEALALIDPFVGMMAEAPPTYHSWALLVRGAAHLASGEAAGAEADLRAGKAAAATVHNEWLGAIADHHLAVVARHEGIGRRAASKAVSYTHLTRPTICSV